MPESPFQFIYIDANVGGSSGGHSALRIDNLVYHFQYFPDGIFRLVREPWNHFRYIYNDLENRTLHVAHIHLEDNDLFVVRKFLNQFYLIQTAHMDRLDSLNDDLRLIRDLDHEHRQISIKGAGLFALQESADEISAQLQTIITDTYGKEYLLSEIKRLDQELAGWPIFIPHLKEMEITNQAYPVPIAGLAKTYTENRLKRTALWVLERGLPINKIEFMNMDDWSHSGERRGLTQNERNKLLSYAEILKKSVVRLPLSNRADWGYPLLLATARFQVIMWSLKYDRLLLLDPFPEAAISVPLKKLQKDSSVTAQLADCARSKYWNIRREIFAAPALDERRYNQLEESAGRFAELEKGNVGGKAIRVAYGRLVPSRTAVVPLPTPKVKHQTIEISLATATANRNIYHEKLKKCYSYNLITKNCATELIRSLNSTFQSEELATRALGGSILPDQGLSFIPFSLFGLVKKRFRVTRIEVLPGFRKRMMLQMKQKEPQKSGLYLRECNTLTSTIYQHAQGDTRFLFFTDDVVLMRPLYGLFNTAYGLLSAAFGILTLPLDGGDLSKDGLKGTIYSLPEIFFCNIRKGSFDYVNDSLNYKVNDLEKSAPAFDRRVSP